MVNAVGAESCQKIIRHPPVGQCRRVQRPLCLYRDEMDEVGGQASNRVRKSSLSSCNRFACSGNSAPSLACSSCLASISWCQRRNWSSGGRFAGLLDMTVSSDGPVGCSRMAKASEIGISLGSGCTQALAYRL